MNDTAENANELLRLVRENSDLPIVPMVDAECVVDDSGYFTATFGRVLVIVKFPDDGSACCFRYVLLCSEECANSIRELIHALQERDGRREEDDDAGS